MFNRFLKNIPKKNVCIIFNVYIFYLYFQYALAADCKSLNINFNLLLSNSIIKYLDHFLFMCLII